MTPSQQAQKDRARAEAEQHCTYSAVDRMRDSYLEQNIVRDARIHLEEEPALRAARDANNSFAGEE